jgi:hypothetical protein
MLKGKLHLSALCAALLLALAVGASSAGRLSLSNQNLRFTFTEFIMRVGESSDICQLTLEGSFHNRTVAKALGTLIGYITRAVAGTCSLATTSRSSRGAAVDPGVLSGAGASPAEAPCRY